MLTRLAIPSLLLAAACSRAPQTPAAPTPAAPPSILLITLDTTRADAIATQPHFAALAARGLRFASAYATAPMTLPSHASMLTGLYPAGHGIHENGRRLSDTHPVLAERLAANGYATAAFVSGFPLAREFGLGRGFEHYDDALPERGVERRAADTARRAIGFLGARSDARPLFVWVHFYDPHEPYDPPPGFHRGDPYLGEIAAMDAAMGELLAVWSGNVLVAGDHGEGRGEHGEALHGNLLYQGVVRVPLALLAPGVWPAERGEPVSLRQIFPTVLGWAGAPAEGGLLAAPPAVVLGEAMQPYLNYRWQPQIMAVEGSIKIIQSGPDLEVYEVDADPAESRDRRGAIDPSRALRAALADYPLPAATAPPLLDDEARQRLASLGYVSGDVPSRGVPATAPHARDMTALFPDLERGSLLFVAERYAESLPVHERILRRDPGNLMVAVRLAVARSLLGRDAAAARDFARAARIDPDSVDLRHYLALHHLRFRRHAEAAALFESVLARQPDRSADWAGLARSRMSLGETEAALAAFERLRSLLAPSGAAFDYELELGVLYLAARRLPEARDALDRVDPTHPAYPMALFKRAQVSVLLGEPDRAARVRDAWERADRTTRPLIERENLFAGLLPG